MTLPTTGQIWPIGALPCPEPPPSSPSTSLATVNNSPSLQFTVPTISIF